MKGVFYRPDQYESTENKATTPLDTSVNTRNINNVLLRIDPHNFLFAKCFRNPLLRIFCANFLT